MFEQMKPLDVTVLSELFESNKKDQTRIKHREGTMIEFKESYSNGNMAQYFKTMASFANNRGGYILFGVADKPRTLVGLNEKSLRQFESLKVETFTAHLLEYFSPEIMWEHCSFESRGKVFGVIYTYALKNKPCICKKNNSTLTDKLILKEADIYYRYGGRSERIRYPELESIIDERRRNEEQMWLNFLKKTAQIGVGNAALLDINTGSLSVKSGTVVIDETLLEKIAFIKEGQFVETGGTPTLRVVGDVEHFEIGKVLVKPGLKKQVAIEELDILRNFLNGVQVSSPLEYIKRACTLNSPNLPIYFYIKSSQSSVNQVIELLEQLQIRGQNKLKLIGRLKGKSIALETFSHTGSRASIEKAKYRSMWLDQDSFTEVENKIYALQALLSLDDGEIVSNKKHILSLLSTNWLSIYNQMRSNEISVFRKVIARLDEVLYKGVIENETKS